MKNMRMVFTRQNPSLSDSESCRSSFRNSGIEGIDGGLCCCEVEDEPDDEDLVGCGGGGGEAAAADEKGRVGMDGLATAEGLEVWKIESGF